jgi:hypothetical protein
MIKFLRLAVFLFFTLSFSGLYAQTNVQGIISSNQVWTASNSPYIITQNTLLDSGVSLDIRPGTIVQSNGSFRFIIDGELIVNGNKDSLVVMDKMKFEFNKECKEYNFSNNTGSHFNFTWFKGDNTGGTNTIKLTDVSLLITNSRFTNCYYAIYAYSSMYDTSKIKVLKTVFESDNGYGSPTSVSGSNVFLEMDECQIYNMCNMYVPANFRFTRSLINKMTCYSGIRIMGGNRLAKANTYIACNVFKNFKANVFEAFYLDTNTSVNIIDNTFDSADVFLTIYAGDINNTFTSVVSGNNFLTAKIYDVKFVGTSQSAGQFIRFDMTDNYWGSSDTALIKAGIYDFQDDITSCYKVDYSSFLSSNNAACGAQFLSVNAVSDSKFNIFPNPASDMVQVRFENSTIRTISLFNAFGVKVKELHSDNETVSFSCKDLSAGVYILNIKEESGRLMSSKLMIAH